MVGRLVFIISVFLFFSLMRAQGQEKKILQFSGLISSVGGGIPVPFVTVTNLSYNNQAHPANNEGFFSFVAHEGDTIRFTSIGFEPLQFVIPKTNTDKYTATISMKSHVIELPAIMPFPWASIEEFNQAFLALDVSDDAASRIRRNLSKEALDALAASVPRSAEEIQAYSSMQRHVNMTNRNMNQRGSNALFSPIAWGSFINSIAKGDYSRKRLKY